MGLLAFSSEGDAIKNALKYLAVFLAGIAAGMFLWSSPHQSTQTPIKVSICSVMQNRKLFDHRQILTTAHLITSIHGEFLSSDECPERVILFTSSLSSEDTGARMLDSQVSAAFEKHYDVDVPVTFVGTVRVRTRIENLTSWIEHHLFRQPVKLSPDLTIDQILAAGPPVDTKH